jgi:hypothetical protein
MKVKAFKPLQYKPYDMNLCLGNENKTFVGFPVVVAMKESKKASQKLHLHM